MAGNVTVDIDQAAVDALFTSWESPVGAYIEQLTTEVHAVARALAPVSRTGSKYAPPGYLKGRVNVARQHQPDGVLLGMVGVPLGTRGGRYPLNFVSNPKGSTRNANRVGGVVRHYGLRPAANRFLLAALRSVVG